MRKTIAVVSTIAIFILMIDVIGMFAWIMSNQIPINKYYIGMITTNIIKLFI